MLRTERILRQVTFRIYSFLFLRIFYLWKMFVEIGSFFGFYPKREEELKYCFLKEEVYYV